MAIAATLRAAGVMAIAVPALVAINQLAREQQGVPSFTFSPADSKKQPMLFELNRPLDDLRGMLLKKYAGRTITMVDIYRDHCVGRRYIKKNYKDILKTMEDGKAITTSGRKSPRGFADDILVTFPAR